MLKKNTIYLQGVAWFIASLFISTCNDIITKYLGHNITPYQVVFCRFLFGTITLLPFMLWHGKKSFYTSRPMVHVIRGSLLFCGIFLWAYALNHVIVTMATVINFTIPLIVVCFARIFLGENVSLARWIATLFGLIGVVVVINPTAIEFDFMSLLLVIGSIMFAGLDIINKKYIVKESMFSMLFYSNLVTLLLSFIPAYYHWIELDLHQLLLIMCLGAGANLILYCILKAFALDDASALAPYRYTELIISSTLGYLIFSEIPSINVLLGAAIIVPATFFVIYNETRKQGK